MRRQGRPSRARGGRGPGWRPAGAVAAAALLGIALLGMGCSGPAAHPAAASRPQPATTVKTAPPATVTAPAPAQSSPPAAPGPVSTRAPAPAPAGATAPPGCATTALTVAIGQENGAAGSIYYPLEFRNVSGASCTLIGYPGVSFATGVGGREIGGAAVRNPTFAAQLVTLAPGATAHASLQVVVAQNYPASLCDPVTAHWLRIFPPNQRAPLYLSFTAVTCTGRIPSGTTLGIYVVRPGTTGP
jgi:Protein of unknown function (DUF4232)